MEFWVTYCFYADYGDGHNVRHCCNCRCDGGFGHLGLRQNVIETTIRKAYGLRGGRCSFRGGCDRDCSRCHDTGTCSADYCRRKSEQQWWLIIMP